MNRIAHLFESRPQPVSAFPDQDARSLLNAYEADPSDVPCPSCGPDQIEVLAFIHPLIDAEGYATTKTPEGVYAAALYCHGCTRAVGVIPAIRAEPDLHDAR